MNSFRCILLFLLATIFFSCSDDDNHLDMDHFIPIKKIFGDSISTDLPDSIIFGTRWIPSCIFSCSIILESEDGKPVKVEKQLSHYYVREPYPCTVLNDSDLTVIQNNDTTYTILTQPLHREAVYTFGLHSTGKSDHSYSPTQMKYYTYGLAQKNYENK